MTAYQILSHKTVATATGSIAYEIVKDAGFAGFGVVRTVREAGNPVPQRTAKFGLTKMAAARRVLDLKRADAAAL